MGAGKTMLSTRYAKKDSDKGKIIYCNYHLKDIDYQPIRSLEDIQKMKNCTAIFDELWLWLFARTSQSNMNKEIMKIVFLNRKRNVEIYYTAQLSRTIDVLLREATEYFAYPYIKKNEETGKYHVAYFVFDRLNRSLTGLKPLILSQNTEYWGQYYDTTEEIEKLGKNKKSPIETSKHDEVSCYKSLEKIKTIHGRYLLPNSGMDNPLNLQCDILALDKKYLYPIDAKGRNKEFVYFDCSTIQKYLDMLKIKYVKPLIVYPRYNYEQDQPFKMLTSPKYWMVYEIKHDTYIKKNKNSKIRADKLEKNSIRMDKYFVKKWYKLPLAIFPYLSRDFYTYKTCDYAVIWH